MFHGGDTFLRNVASHRTTRHYIPEDSNIQNVEGMSRDTVVAGFETIFLDL
jgi:hypothetical protein